MSDIKDRPVLGRNLVLLRKKYGLTQAELAERSGVSRRTIALYEKRESNPPIDNIEKLAGTLQVSIEELIGAKPSSNNLDEEFLNIDSRTLKKIKQILELTPEQRHMVYSLAESLSSKKS